MIVGTQIRWRLNVHFRAQQQSRRGDRPGHLERVGFGRGRHPGVGLGTEILNDDFLDMAILLVDLPDRDEAVDDFEAVAGRIIRAVSLSDERDVVAAANLPLAVTPLVDRHDRTRRGGTGQKANWELAGALAARRPIWLAGGLTGSNVAEAIRAVKPAGVDVSSGVESAPGVKDRARLEAFITAVREAETEGL